MMTTTFYFTRIRRKACNDFDDLFKVLSGAGLEIDNRFKTTKAFSILSIISSFVTLVAACFVAVGKFGKSKFIYIGLLISCCCQLIALSVFTDFYKDEIKLFNRAAQLFGEYGISLGWAYVLGWVGFAIAGISGLVGCIMHNNE